MLKRRASEEIVPESDEEDRSGHRSSPFQDRGKNKARPGAISRSTSSSSSSNGSSVQFVKESDDSERNNPPSLASKKAAAKGKGKAKANAGTSAEGNPTVISFSTSSLKVEDLETLDGGEWLNDNILAFWFDLISSRLPADARSKVALWPPSIVELLCSLESGTEKDAADMLPPPASIVFLPINDRYASETHAGVGTHWSLLVICAASDPHAAHARHYDSLRPHNRTAAERVWSRYKRLLGADFGRTRGAGKERLEEADELEAQQNAFDCGLYPLVLSALLLENGTELLEEKGAGGASAAKRIASRIKPKAVERFREDVHKWLVDGWCGFPVAEQEGWRDWHSVETCVGSLPTISL